MCLWAFDVYESATIKPPLGINKGRDFPEVY